MTGLSVITITKNSARRIENVVVNALEIGDESIVVDTGSTDGTPERAARAGARVLKFTGEFDYSTPRNLGTRAATKDWALHLDDDEKIDPKYREQMSRLISAGEFDSFSLYQLTRCNGCPKQDTSMQKRLFKRSLFEHAGLVWEHIYPLRRNSYAHVVLENIKEHKADELSLKRFRYGLSLRELASLMEQTPDDEQGIAQVISRYFFLWPEIPSSEKEKIPGLVQDAYNKAVRLGINGPAVRYTAASFINTHLVMPEKALNIMDAELDRPEIDPDYLLMLGYIQSRVDTELVFPTLDRVDSSHDLALSYQIRRAVLHGFGNYDGAEVARRKAREIFPEDPTDRIELPRPMAEVMGKFARRTIRRR